MRHYLSDMKTASTNHKRVIFTYLFGAVLGTTVWPVLLEAQQSETKTASPAVAGVTQTVSPSFSAYVGGGMYQLNFQLPPTPSGVPACDGTTVKSNLTITITGSNSYDAAQVCVAP